MCRFKYFQKLTVKDYAIIGIYSLLILVIQIVLGIFSSPFLLYSYVLFCGPVSFLAAPIYILMAVKVGKSGVAFIFNIIRGLMFVAFGAPMLMILFIISGIFAELALLGETGYKTQLRQTISWTISSVFLWCPPDFHGLPVQRHLCVDDW